MVLEMHEKMCQDRARVQGLWVKRSKATTPLYLKRGERPHWSARSSSGGVVHCTLLFTTIITAGKLKEAQQFLQQKSPPLSC